jgi:hypothetical protein
MQRHGLLILLAAFTADAFMPHQQRLVFQSSSRTSRGRHAAFASTTSSSSSLLEMASGGFGASSSSSSSASASSSSKNNKGRGSNKKKDSKLKPKQQWDRYGDLKASETVRVAVRIIDDSSEQQQRQQQQQQWLLVGTVKSKDNAYTEAAVIRHRVLIAEHARRIFPLQISAKDKLEWAYRTSNTAMAPEEGWVVAGKVENLPDDIDKLIGFEGLPDPTGFYARSTEKLGYRSVADFNNMMKKGEAVGNNNNNAGLEVNDS